MKGSTNDYYELFLNAKDNFLESGLVKNFSSNLSDHRVIYDEISRLLCDPVGIWIDSLNAIKQLVIEEKLSSESSEIIHESLVVLQTIRNAVNDKVLPLSNKAPWIEAIHLSMLYCSRRKIDVYNEIPNEYRLLADSLFYLKKRGFNIESTDGYIKAEDPELTRLASAIEYRAKKLGKQGFVGFLNVIEKKFSRDNLRFYFYRNRTLLPSLPKPSPPYGYVFNLFCKNLNSSLKIKENKLKKLFGEVQDLSTHLATVLDIDKMSPWANLNVDIDNILEKITEWILYPEIFYIPQISPIHGKRIFPRIFEFIDNSTEDALSEIVKASAVMNKIEDYIYQQGFISGEFTESDIIQLCSDIDNAEKIKQILHSISKPANEINKGYISPFDAYKSNVREYPLIKIKTGYIVVNIATFNIAKYRALTKISEKYNSKTDLKLGFALEKLIKESFDKSNIEYHHNVTYSAPDYVKQITNTNRDKGECDFIIESREYIYLIEVKKKGLTKEALSGSQLHMLIDTSLSFIRSINQLTIAELILLNEGKLSYSDGRNEIVLNKREIFKIVISLEDMASLQCDNIKNFLMNGLYNIKIDVDDESFQNQTDRVNKILDEFRRLNSELIAKGGIYQKNPFYRTSYLSTPQLLTLLDDVNNNEDLSYNIYRCNSVVYNLMDWYASYNLSKENKLIKNHRNVFKNTVLIN
jgi:hypothetical protein